MDSYKVDANYIKVLLWPISYGITSSKITCNELIDKIYTFLCENWNLKMNDNEWSETIINNHCQQLGHKMKNFFLKHIITFEHNDPEIYIYIYIYIYMHEYMYI